MVKYLSLNCIRIFYQYFTDISLQLTTSLWIRLRLKKIDPIILCSFYCYVNKFMLPHKSQFIAYLPVKYYFKSDIFCRSSRFFQAAWKVFCLMKMLFVHLGSEFSLFLTGWIIFWLVKKSFIFCQKMVWICFACVFFQRYEIVLVF